MTEFNIKTKTAEKCRIYPNSPNGLQPSVTSITGCLMKYALVDWAAGCAVDYIQNHSFTAEQAEEVFAAARTAHKQISKTAADTGTDVHELCALWLTNQDTREAESNATPDMLTLFEAFKEWCKENKIEVIHSEIVLHGDGYSGRCDLIAYRTDPKTGRRYFGVYDIKTGKGSYYPEWGLQLAAYANAYENWAIEKDEEYPWPVQEIGIIKLNKETLRCNFKTFTEEYHRLAKAFNSLTEFYWEYNNLQKQFEEIKNEQSIHDEAKP